MTEPVPARKWNLRNVLAAADVSTTAPARSSEPANDPDRAPDLNTLGEAVDRTRRALVLAETHVVQAQSAFETAQAAYIAADQALIDAVNSIRRKP